MTKSMSNKVAWLLAHTAAGRHDRLSIKVQPGYIKVYSQDHEGRVKDSFCDCEVVQVVSNLFGLRCLFTADIEGRVYFLLF